MSNVTVVIPTYNGERFVAEAVESIARQSAPPRQIIVVDDGSTDATAEKVEQIAAHSDLPIRLIELPHNSGGPARPINIGVAAASTEWVAVLDQDDLYTQNALMQLSGLLERNPQLGCAAMLCGRYPQGPAVLRSSVLAEVLASGKAREGWCEIPPETCLRQILVHGQFLVGCPGFMFRRKLWAAKGGVCELLKIASDVELLCWICSRCPIWGALGLIVRWSLPGPES